MSERVALELVVGLLEKQQEQIDKLERTLKNHEKVWDRIDRDVQLFGNKVVGYGLEE